MEGVTALFQKKMMTSSMDTGKGVTRIELATLNLAHHNLADDYFLFEIRNSKIVFFIMIHICTTMFGRTQIVKSEQN